MLFFYDLLRIYYVQYIMRFCSQYSNQATISKCPHSHFLFLFWNIYRCVWCQTTVHDDCLSSLNDDLCDLGEFRSVIIPPYYLYQVNKLRRRHPDEYSKVRIHPQTQTLLQQRIFFLSRAQVIGPKTAFFLNQAAKMISFQLFFCL